MKPSDLLDNEYLPYFGLYIGKAPQSTILQGLETGIETVLNVLQEFPIEKFDYRYAVGKWTIKEVLQHIIDTERIFGYRALRIARGDQTPIAGFDQDDYVTAAKSSDKLFDAMLEDYKVCRANTIAMFRSFDDEMLMQIGNVSGANMSTRAAGYIIVGHELHHMDVLQERYL